MSDTEPTEPDATEPDATEPEEPSTAPARESPTEGVSPLTWLVLVGLLAVVVYSLIPTSSSTLPSGDDVEALLSEGRATAKRTGDGGGVLGALPYFQRAVTVAPKDPAANGTLGRALVELTRYDEALPFLQRAKAASPSVYEVNLYLGMCLTGLERHEEARGPLEEAIRVRPDSPQPLYYLGVGAMRLRQLDKTVEYLARYVPKMPRNLVAARMYADALAATGREADAIAALSSLVALTPRDVAARRALQGRRIRLEGIEPVLRDAAADVEREKGPESMYLHSRLLALLPDRATETRALLQRLKEQFPNVVRADLDLAIEDVRDGELETARKRLAGVIVSSPGSVEARVLLADLALQGERFDVAHQAYTRMLGGRLNAHAELGIVSTHLDQGKGEEALRFVATLLEGVSEGDPRRWALQGELLKALGRFDESRTLLDGLLE
jgi:tetratricopeptide (TPR) repeat protein